MKTSEGQATHLTLREDFESAILTCWGVQMKGFISYSHRDSKMVLDFRDHLAILATSLGIKLWIDEEIRAGDEWDKSIKTALDEAQVFIFCVSVSFLNSKYIQQVELKEARKKHDAGSAIIIPVLMKPCLYQSVEFLKDIQALPKGARPITAWRPYDRGYSDTAGRIGALLKSRLNTGATP